MSLLRYISHPNVHLDPQVPVPQWSLSTKGLRRARALVVQPWVLSIGTLVSSGETKALQTAELLADQTGISIDVRRRTGEIDRRATGFVAPDRHEKLADQLFEHPTRSAAGWETAKDAQRRIVDAVADLVVDGSDDVAIVGHGGVGTLLYCHLAALQISREHDQPGQGHYWTYDRSGRTIVPPGVQSMPRCEDESSSPVSRSRRLVLHSRSFRL